MKTFSFNKHAHVSLTHACILAAREAGFSVSLAGHCPPLIRSEGGFLHFEETRNENEYHVFQNEVLLGDYKIVGMYVDYHGEILSLDDFITKFSQMSVEDIVKEFVTDSVAKLQDGSWYCSNPYTKALVAELWDCLPKGYN